MIVTDGGFAPTAPSSWPCITTALTAAFRRAVLRLFVRRGLFGRTYAMLAGHSGFHVHDAVLVPDSDVAFASASRFTARAILSRSSA
jgi:hypothetical protein